MSRAHSIKRGDTVLVMKGKNRGRKGKVLSVLISRSALMIEGVNEKTRHVKPKRSGEKGQKVTVNHPVKRDNVLMLCPNCSRGTRVVFKASDAGKKIRVCKKCGKDIL